MVDAISSLVHMPTSVSRRLNIACIMFKIIMFYYENAWIYVRVGIILTVGKLLLDRIIVHREEGCALKLVQTSHLLFIGLPQV